MLHDTKQSKYTHQPAHTHTYTHIHTHMHTYTHTHIHTYTHTHIHTHRTGQSVSMDEAAKFVAENGV